MTELLWSCCFLLKGAIFQTAELFHSSPKHIIEFIHLGFAMLMGTCGVANIIMSVWSSAEHMKSTKGKELQALHKFRKSFFFFFLSHRRADKRLVHWFHFRNWNVEINMKRRSNEDKAVFVWHSAKHISCSRCVCFYVAGQYCHSNYYHPFIFIPTAARCEWDQTFSLTRHVWHKQRMKFVLVLFQLQFRSHGHAEQNTTYMWWCVEPFTLRVF